MEVKPLCRLVFALVSFALLAQPALCRSSPGDGGDFAHAYEEFRANYLSELRKGGFVGSSFYLVRDNRVVAREFYGLADAERGVPVDEETIYHWASITKTCTGIAIMQLRDRGLLRLDDPVVKYIPELRAAHDPFGDMSENTIRHLMTHSAGFRNPTWTWRDDSKDRQPFESLPIGRPAGRSSGPAGRTLTK
jgi:CubicO group peptidase (beta-lactamase class C family)